MFVALAKRECRVNAWLTAADKIVCLSVCVALKDSCIVPTFVVSMQVPDWTKDNAAGRKILQHHDLEVFESPLHLEGGSIHSDGQG